MKNINSLLLQLQKNPVISTNDSLYYYSLKVKQRLTKIEYLNLKVQLIYKVQLY